MQISEYTDRGVRVLAVDGRIDSSTAKQFEDVLPARVAEHPALILNLANVPYVSSAGLRVLLRSAKIAQQQAHRLVLCDLSSSVREVFDVSGFTRLFVIEPDLATALDSFR